MRYLFILLALLCVSCGTAVPSIKPYKLDIQQGNVVTSKMLLQLRPGMTKSQVRFIMGTPLIQDSFHRDRWDYFYQMRQGGKVIEQRRVILEFENELLKKVRGDVVPAGTDPLKAGEGQENTGTRVIAPEKKSKEKGVLDKLKFWEKDEPKPAEAAPAKEAVEKEAGAKAQKEAEEAASKAAVEVKEAPAPAAAEEAPKSMLVVPLELPKSAEPPVSAPAPLPAATPAAGVIQKTPIAEPAVPQEPAAVVSPPVESAPVAVQPESPASSPSYAPESGMVFDKQLRFGLEELEPKVAPAAADARTGNKVPPAPKDLPEEDSPSFFDRMLEKIGF